MADKLSIYNGALAHLKERRLKTLSDEIETRFVLDDIWASAAIPDLILEESDWAFARKSVKLEPTPERESAFGYEYIFELSPDIARISSISIDPYYNTPLINYQTESNMIFSNYIETYIRYVSYEAGRDLGKWSRSFTEIVEHYLAYRCAGRLGEASSAEIDRYQQRYEKSLNNAIAHNSVAEPTVFLPAGRWRQSRVHSRFDGRGYRHGRT